MMSREPPGAQRPTAQCMSQPNCQRSECGDRVTQLGFKKFEFDLIQLPAQLINPRNERR
jgi:hypothetical protein